MVDVRYRVYLFLVLLSGVFSILPFVMLSREIVYISLCDVEAWFDLGRCLVSPVDVVVYFVGLFFLSVIVLIGVYEVIGFVVRCRLGSSDVDRE